MSPVTRVGVSATPAPWSKVLRSYARDHASGVEIETLLDPRYLVRSDRQRLHILVVDDVARIFTPDSIAAAGAAGTFVIGLSDEANGMGRAYLERLGVQLVLPVSTAPEELLRTFDQLAPPETAIGPFQLAHDSTGARHGRLSVWYSVSGGSGLTEAMIGTAQVLARSGRVLVIEVDPVSAVMAARLNRSPSSGLAWCLNRISQGRPCIPEGLSGPAEDAASPLGAFDVITQGSAVAGSVIDARLLNALADEALASYDQVVVAAGPLAPGSGGANRDVFSPGRTLLPRADVALAWTTSDPIGALVLGKWRTTADDLRLAGQAWAVLGRSSRSRFEEQQLAEVVQVATASRQFNRLCFLPEDDAVRRARWNGTMVTRGRWADGVRRLAGALVAAPLADRAQDRSSWGLVMAP